MSRSVRGFTLIELVVVIAIIAILSLIGYSIYSGAQKSARDARRKEDIDAISKAYEIKFTSTGSYQALDGTEFGGNNIPTPPEGGAYVCLAGPNSGGNLNCPSPQTNSFTVCARLEGFTGTCTTSEPKCYCKVSTQSTGQ